MLKRLRDLTSRGIIYLVAIAIGFAFSFLLVSISWNTALEREENSFQYDSRVLQQLIEQSFTNANDVVEDITVYMETQNDINVENFALYTDSFLERHQFIESINYIDYDRSYFPATLKLKFQNKRNKNQISTKEHYFLSESFREAIEYSYRESEVSSSAPVARNNNVENIWLLKTVAKESKLPRISGYEYDFSGIIAINLKPDVMLQNLYSKNNLDILIYKDTENQIGRQLVFTKNSVLEDAFDMRSFISQNRVQLPLYTINTEIQQKVYWQDIKKSTIYISALIGFGVTLLLIALIRSREQRNKELASRNIVIETQVEEQTKELAVARDQALEAVKIKADFLASMSHEIRTPLNAITGMADLLAETKLNEEQHKYVDVFRKAGDALLSLVNDILDLSKLEAEQLQLEEIPFNLFELLEETSDIYALKAAEKNIDLVCDIDLNLRRYRIGDPSRLRQIILNLISNAIKFTEKGNIVVHAKSSKDNEESVRFCVSDTGIGIKKDKLESIFASFTQADSSTTRKYGGTGLGLTISKSLVEMMLGKIWVESNYGNGSQFYFDVNLPLQNKKVEDKKFSQEISVAIFDDDKLHANTLYNILQKFSAEATVYSSLENDFNELGKHQLLFIDSLLFIKHKEKVLKQIGTKKVILVVRPDLFSLHFESLKKEGMEGFLHKPIKINDVYKEVERKLGTSDITEREKRKEQSLDDNKRYKILLVEDNPDNRLLIKAYLKKMPYQIIEAENGEIALSLFKTSDFDLVLMDVQMPVMDGHTATKLIREYEVTNNKQQTPIVSLTAHAIKEEIDKCFEAGCNMHLSKPVKKALLNEMIKDLLTNQT